MFTGISVVVASSEGKLFTTFLTVASETHWKEDFLFSLKFVLDFNSTRVVGKTFNSILDFFIGDI